jgi:hypothetical protein
MNPIVAVKLILLTIIGFVLFACASGQEIEQYKTVKTERQCGHSKSPATCRLGSP